MRVEERREPDALEQLKEPWLALEEADPAATVYQTWDWNRAWWRCFNARKRLRILVFRSRAGEIAGIAPLYQSRHLGTPIRRLAWLGTGVSDYLMPLALPQWRDDVWRVLFSHLTREMRSWDMADLQQIPEGCVPEWEEQSSALEGALVRRLPMEPCPAVELPGTWDEYAARLGKKMRSNVAYYERLLRREFADAQYVVAEADSLNEGLKALFTLHQKRWNARWLPGALGGPRIQQFHRLVAQGLQQRGSLRLHLLRAGGEYRAALYCFAHRGSTLYYLGGFDPGMARYSLGTVLTAHAIRTAIGEGHQRFDFLRGAESYKYRWQPVASRNQRLLVLRGARPPGGAISLAGRAGGALHHLECYVERRAKSLARRAAQSGTAGLATSIAARKQDTDEY